MGISTDKLAPFEVLMPEEILHGESSFAISAPVQIIWELISKN